MKDLERGGSLRKPSTSHPSPPRPMATLQVPENQERNRLSKTVFDDEKDADSKNSVATSLDYLSLDSSTGNYKKLEEVPELGDTSQTKC